MWIVLAYAMVGILIARKIYPYLLTEDMDEPEDKFLMGLMSFLCAVVWPLAIPIAAIMYKPKKDKSNEMRDRIWELEDSLNIKRSEF